MCEEAVGFELGLERGCTGLVRSNCLSDLCPVLVDTSCGTEFNGGCGQNQLKDSGYNRAFFFLSHNVRRKVNC